MLQPIVLTQSFREDEPAWPLDAERVATWLGALYSSSRWPITSDRPYPGETALEINFDVPVEGGTLLDHPSLYQSAKELIFWARELQSMETAENHRSWASYVFAFMAYLVRHGIESFDQIEPDFYSQALKEWSQGANNFHNAGDTVAEYLSKYKSAADIPADFLAFRHFGPVLARKAILAACGLRSGTSETRAAFDCATERLGLEFDGGRREVEIEPKADEITRAANHQRQAVWKFMFEHRGLLECANFSFDPSSFGNNDGRAKGGSPVPPPDLVFALHAGAYAFALREAADLAERRRTLLASSAGALNTRKVFSERFQWTSTALTTCLATWIQVGLMTARRPLELWLMQRNCLRGNDNDGWYVKIYIVKNRKEWVWIPIPPTVAEAIQRLIALSPLEPVTGPLFAIRCLATGNLRRLGCYPDVGRFAESVGAVDYLAENDVQSKWTWTPKQLRRYTSHLFYWGYGGSIAVISHILHHFNVGQSSVYTKLDSGARKAWKRVEEAFKRNIARQAIEGTLGGHAGRGLIRDAKRLEENLRKKFGEMLIIDPDDLIPGMLEVIRRKLLVFIPKAWVVCACPETEGATRRAMCRKQPGDGTSRELGPDFAKAGPTVCPGCIWAIENEVTRAFADKDRQQMKLACKGAMQGTVLGDLQAAKLIAIMEPAE